MATRNNQTMEFICNCLVFNDDYIDKLFTEFDIEMDQSEVYDALDVCHDKQDYQMFGNLIIGKVFEHIQEKYVEQGLDGDKFDWSIDNWCSVLRYDGKEIKYKSQLDGIIRKKREAEEWEKLRKAPREFRLSARDKRQLLEWGYLSEDLEQIEIEANVCTYELYSRKGDKQGNIDRDEAIRILGRKEWLSGIGRTAFHWSAGTENKSGTKQVSFESGLPGRYNH